MPGDTIEQWENTITRMLMNGSKLANCTELP
jgi:hypothetical protein